VANPTGIHIFGKDGLLSEHAKGKTIIVMSTLDPDSMNELGKKVEDEAAALQERRPGLCRS
jgi:3-hydroxyisobutyrate dehydrogenase-like beta-hydroxyacid dehydrogenase